jgi:hypothetical protein
LIYESIVRLNFETLIIGWRKGVSGIESCTKLTLLSLGGYKERDLKRLSPIINLRTLLMKRGAPESLKGLESAQQLEKVIFGNSKKLKDIQAMSQNAQG